MKEAKKFIEDNIELVSEKKNDDNLTQAIFKMTQANYKKFMSERGITSKVLDQYNGARKELSNATMSVAADKLVSLGKKTGTVLIRTTTPIEQLTIGAYCSKKTTNPATGVKSIKYGGGIYRSRGKMFSKDVLEAQAKAVEKMMTK